jgi:hypothetical protein
VINYACHKPATVPKEWGGAVGRDLSVFGAESDFCTAFSGNGRNVNDTGHPTRPIRTAAMAEKATTVIYPLQALRIAIPR